jgi:hypothetical protein
MRKHHNPNKDALNDMKFIDWFQDVIAKGFGHHKLVNWGQNIAEFAISQPYCFVNQIRDERSYWIEIAGEVIFVVHLFYRRAVIIDRGKLFELDWISLCWLYHEDKIVSVALSIAPNLGHWKPVRVVQREINCHCLAYINQVGLWKKIDASFFCHLINLETRDILLNYNQLLVKRRFSEPSAGRVVLGRPVHTLQKKLVFL